MPWIQVECHQTTNNRVLVTKPNTLINDLVSNRTYSYATLDQHSIDELQAMVDGHPQNQDFDAVLAELDTVCLILALCV